MQMRVRVADVQYTEVVGVDVDGTVTLYTVFDPVSINSATLCVCIC